MSSPVPRVVHWRRAVLASTLSHGQVRVAMALAEHMNGAGESCWPSVDRLVRESSTDRRSVQRALRKLETVGWIERRNAGRGGRGHATEYRAAFPDSPERAAGAPPFTDEKARPNVHKRAAGRVQKGGADAAPSRQEDYRGGRSRARGSHADAPEDRLAALDAHPRRFTDEELAEFDGHAAEPDRGSQEGEA